MQFSDKKTGINANKILFYLRYNYSKYYENTYVALL